MAKGLRAGDGLRLLFGAALLAGGSVVLARLPKFLDAVMPGKAVGARSNDGVARLVLPRDFSQSSPAPQVSHRANAIVPDELTDAARDPQSTLPIKSGPLIAICIDDLGGNAASTGAAIALPKEVALSFLPYADKTPLLAVAAARKGHLVLAHVPMQAFGDTDPGPMALRTDMTVDEIARRVTWNLSRVPGIAGINNHEGSRFTADPAALAPVMAALKARHLFFFDSRTSAATRAATVARRMGVVSAERDVFLDDDPAAAPINAQLDLLARMAKRNGVAIAIGHPHGVTLRLLAAWLAQDHGVTLVPLDEAIRMKLAREKAVAAR